MPPKTQKNEGPKSFTAFRPTLHVRLPGSNVLTWMCANFVPSTLLHKMSTFGVFPSVTTAAYPLRHNSPAIKNWLALPRYDLSRVILFANDAPEPRGLPRRAPGAGYVPFSSIRFNILWPSCGVTLKLVACWNP